CGYGHGYSVRQVINAIERLNGQRLSVIYTDRRAGDPPELVADASQLKQLFGWQPRYDDLDAIVESSLTWERKIASGAVVAGRAVR
ncbi:MAG: UDP-glucose 4-epimerase GalE, partial [Gammaproteobacteria bacterium]